MHKSPNAIYVGDSVVTELGALAIVVGVPFGDVDYWRLRLQNTEPPIDTLALGNEFKWPIDD